MLLIGNELMIDRYPNQLDAPCILGPIIDRPLTKPEFEAWKKEHTECIANSLDVAIPKTWMRYRVGTGEPEDQHLYVMVDAEFGAIKIGITKNLVTRLHYIRRELCAPHIFLLAFGLYRGLEIEQEIHSYLHHHRVPKRYKRGGEWFWLSGMLGFDLWIMGMTKVAASLWRAYEWEPAR